MPSVARASLVDPAALILMSLSKYGGHIHTLVMYFSYSGAAGKPV